MFVRKELFRRVAIVGVGLAVAIIVGLGAAVVVGSASVVVALVAVVSSLAITTGFVALVTTIAGLAVAPVVIVRFVVTVVASSTSALLAVPCSVGFQWRGLRVHPCVVIAEPSWGLVAFFWFVLRGRSSSTGPLVL